MRRFFQNLGFGALVAAAATSNLGCGTDSGVPAPGTEAAQPSGGGTVGADREGRELFASSLDTMHEGIRLVEVYRWDDGGSGYLSYRERIVTDGEGRFTVIPTELITSDGIDWGSFLLTARIREGFTFRYRDFEIRDGGLFAGNYTVQALETTVQIAGRDCTEYVVERRAEDGLSYFLAVDLETRLILSMREEDEQGRTLTSVQYETFSTTPDVSTVVFHESSNDEDALGPRESLSGRLGFEVLQPKLPPSGFELREVALVRDPTGTRWTKLTYVDGVEPVFFLERIPEDDEETTTSTLGGGPPQPDEVTVFEIGAAIAVKGRIAGRDLIALGKVSEREILDFVESALP